MVLHSILCVTPDAPDFISTRTAAIAYPRSSRPPRRATDEKLSEQAELIPNVRKDETPRGGDVLVGLISGLREVGKRVIW
jgi:hypothetical protein